MDYVLLEIQDKVKIDGESTLKGFEKFIELSSYSHGVSNDIQPTTSNTGRTSGRPNLQELTVTKNLDSTTPKINYYCVMGQCLGTTRLHLVRQDATADGKIPDAIDYMVYEMTDTMITSVSVGGGSIPMETVSLDFSKITWTYKSQKTEDGVEETVEQFWDQVTNTGG